MVALEAVYPPARLCSLTVQKTEPNVLYPKKDGYSDYGRIRGDLLRKRRVGMRKLMMILPALMLSVFLFQTETNAAPGMANADTAVKLATDGAVQKVHGCHRRAQKGPITGLWHKHKGGFCIWTPAASPCKSWRNVCRKRCYRARNPRRCVTRCYRRNAPRFCWK